MVVYWFGIIGPSDSSNSRDYEDEILNDSYAERLIPSGLLDDDDFLERNGTSPVLTFRLTFLI
jgi:hypothetical protein